MVGVQVSNRNWWDLKWCPVFGLESLSSHLSHAILLRNNYSWSCRWGRWTIIVPPLNTLLCLHENRGTCLVGTNHKNGSYDIIRKLFAEVTGWTITEQQSEWCFSQATLDVRQATVDLNKHSICYQPRPDINEATLVLRTFEGRRTTATHSALHSAQIVNARPNLN